MGLCAPRAKRGVHTRGARTDGREDNSARREMLLGCLGRSTTATTRPARNTCIWRFKQPTLAGQKKTSYTDVCLNFPVFCRRSDPSPAGQPDTSGWASLVVAVGTCTGRNSAQPHHRPRPRSRPCFEHKLVSPVPVPSSRCQTPVSAVPAPVASCCEGLCELQGGRSDSMLPATEVT